MKRALTGIAAAAVVLGSVSPMAFAATTTSGLTKANPLPIVVNGSAISTPYEMTGKDSGNTTGFFPIYYFNQALAKIGFTATWDGVTHTWAITAPGVTASAVAGGVGTGNTTVTVNGTVVKKFNTQVAKDPAGGPKAQATTYLPIYYISNVLSALGVKGNFSGQTGLSITGGVATTSENLSAITATGATAGDGSIASPATSLNGAAINLSTNLTDQNGNPVANTAVTFNFKLNGYSAPTVVSGSNTLVGTTSVDGKTVSFTAYTDSTGTASVQVTGPSGTTTYYGVYATAPVNGVKTATSNIEFVANGQAGIAPLGTMDSPQQEALGTAVPVTVTLPPNGTTPVADAAVTVNVDNGFLTNASGANLGQTATVYTNSVGQAQVYVNDATAGQIVTVSATSTGTSATIPSTYLEWQQSGIAAKLSNVVLSNNSPQAGQNVTISGQAQDASGNPVANAQLLVTSDGGNGQYVSGSTATDFPNAVGGLNVPATSAYGDVITTDASGNFSITVTDTDDENDTFHFWAVQNGYVVSANEVGNQPVDFIPSTSLYGIAAAASQGTLANAVSQPYTTVSGIEAASGITATAYFEPITASDTALTDQTETYNLSVDNKGDIAQINGVNLTNQVSAVQLTVTYNSATNDYSFSVPGQPGVSIPNAATPEFTVGVTNSNTGTTNLSVASGSVTSKATMSFGSGNATQVVNVSPSAGQVQPGQSESMSFTVEDANGNPVSNSAFTLSTDEANQSAAGFWITGVNGVTLTQNASVNSTNESVSTPVPLFNVASGTSVTTDEALGYASVNLPGVASWTPANGLTVYTDANGQVTLNIAAGDVGYYTNGGAANTTSGIATNGSNATALSAVAGLQEDLGINKTGAFGINLYSNADSAVAATNNLVGSVAVAPQSGTVNAAKSSFTVTGPSTITLSTPVTVAGTVEDAYGNAISGATITATGVGTTTPATVTTGSNGTFSFTADPTSVGTDAVTVTATLGSATVLGTKDITVQAGPIMGAEVSQVSAPLASPENVALAAPGATQTQTVTGLAPSTTYTFTVDAVDAAGNPTTNGANGQTANVVLTPGKDGAGNTNTTALNGVDGDGNVTFNSNGTATFTITTGTTQSGGSGTPDTVVISFGATNTDTISLAY